MGAIKSLKNKLFHTEKTKNLKQEVGIEEQGNEISGGNSIENSSLFNLDSIREEQRGSLGKELYEGDFRIYQAQYETYKVPKGSERIQKIISFLELWKMEKLGIYETEFIESQVQREETEWCIHIEKYFQGLLIKIEEVEHKIMSLQIEEEHLKEEILVFTNMVNEVSNKFKLSPTWEGKKAGLIEQQKQLEERRNGYETKVKAVDSELEAMWQEYDPLRIIIKKQYELNK